MDRYKETLEVTSDAEWSALQPLIEKVTEARLAVAAFEGRGGFGRAGGRRGGGGARRGGFGGFGGEPSPEVAALREAIQSNASADVLKTRLAAVKSARKVKADELTKAQDNLRKVLSVRQEAIATVQLNLLD